MPPKSPNAPEREQGHPLNLDLMARWIHSDEPLSRKTPLSDRKATRRVFDALLSRWASSASSSSDEGAAATTNVEEEESTATTAAVPTTRLLRPPLANVHGYGPLVLSDVPQSCRRANSNSPSPSVVVGIDEAGRGSVLGPMVYGCAYWSTELQDTTVPKGFNDSKQLTEEHRTKLFDAMLEAPDVGFATRILYASEISRHMLRPHPYNLNQMSHDAAMDLIRSLKHAGVSIQTCYVDTVGNPDHYRRLLEREFHDIEFVVESKADAKYAPCSAASVVAKVLRDALLANWNFTEPLNQGHPASRLFGSGYPSDPTCQAWLERQKDPVFGYCDLVRFSWAPIKKALQPSNTAKGSGAKGLLADSPAFIANVEFAADLDDDGHPEHSLKSGSASSAAISRKRQRDQLQLFLRNQRKPFPYFQRCKLEHVSRIQK